MPPYEAAVILVKNVVNVLQKKEMLKSACDIIFQQGGLIRKMENLGIRELPHPIKANSERHTSGNYYIIQFESSAESLKMIEKDYKHTKEILHFGFIKREEEPVRPCSVRPCHFGELPSMEHERLAYKKTVLGRVKNKRVPNI